MSGFSVLTNRKRAVVALAHSVVFLSIAVGQMVAANPGFGEYKRKTTRVIPVILLTRVK